MVCVVKANGIESSFQFAFNSKGEPVNPSKKLKIKNITEEMQVILEMYLAENDKVEELVLCLF